MPTQQEFLLKAIQAAKRRRAMQGGQPNQQGLPELVPGMPLGQPQVPPPATMPMQGQPPPQMNVAPPMQTPAQTVPRGYPQPKAQKPQGRENFLQKIIDGLGRGASELLKGVSYGRKGYSKLKLEEALSPLRTQERERQLQSQLGVQKELARYKSGLPKIPAPLSYTQKTSKRKFDITDRYIRGELVTPEEMKVAGLKAPLEPMKPNEKALLTRDVFVEYTDKTLYPDLNAVMNSFRQDTDMLRELDPKEVNELWKQIERAWSAGDTEARFDPSV